MYCLLEATSQQKQLKSTWFMGKAPQITIFFTLLHNLTTLWITCLHRSTLHQKTVPFENHTSFQKKRNTTSVHQTKTETEITSASWAKNRNKQVLKFSKKNTSKRVLKLSQKNRCSKLSPSPSHPSIPSGPSSRACDPRFQDPSSRPWPPLGAPPGGERG